MDFFNAQKEAHRSTNKLIFLFACAVACLIVALYFMVSAYIWFTGAECGWSDAELLLATGLATLAVVGAGTIYKINQLKGGGAAVCRMMRANEVPLTAPDQQTRRLRNLVEEMALAAGVPVPRLFVLDDGGINAFAAGFTPRDAAICVTRGSIEKFNRDELQGVIAHEFSHILNGDMRLNIRLMGVLHGIVCISLAGYVLLRNGHYAGGRRGGVFGMLLAGFVLVLLGSIGAMFARLIKAAVSRQREFLADASAVQFTRNPKGIRDALKTIGGYATAGSVESVHARAASHMFFVNAISARVDGWFSTHPPIEDRIRAIEPQVVLYERDERARHAGAVVGEAVAGFAGTTTSSAGAANLSTQRAVASVGQVTPDSLAFGRRILQELPLDVSVAMREAFSARAVVYCLLLDEDREIRRSQLRRLQETADSATLQETIHVSSSISQLDRGLRLPLIDLATPALRTMSLSQARAFRENVKSLIEADDRVSLFEFCVEKILDRCLDDLYAGPRSLPVRFRRIDEVIDDCRRILTALARHGHANSRDALVAFERGASLLHYGEPRPMSADECGGLDLERSMENLAHASPDVKRTALTAFAETVASDGELTPVEAELLRAVADTMECPMPPIPLAAEPALV